MAVGDDASHRSRRCPSGISLLSTFFLYSLFRFWAAQPVYPAMELTCRFLSIAFGTVAFLTALAPTQLGEPQMWEILQSGKISSPEAPRIILTWTKFFGNPMTHQHYIIENGCDNLNCRITTDRSEVETAHALVFHTMADFDLADLPARRHPQQRYVMLAHESPENGHHVPTYDTNQLRDFFNWTMTMRRSSDIPYPYAVIREKAGSAMSPEALRLAIHTHFKRKTKPAIWFVSHCDTTSKREKVVALMQKHMAVSVVGFCGGAEEECSRSDRAECEKHLLNNVYFFHLAFENSVCNDYITEKYLWRYNYWSIPIVLSRKVVEGQVPPNSVIAVDDFPNPRLLATYLRSLMNNQTAYAQYFQWKLKGTESGGRAGPTELRHCRG